MSDSFYAASVKSPSNANGQRHDGVYDDRVQRAFTASEQALRGSLPLVLAPKITQLK